MGAAFPYWWWLGPTVTGSISAIAVATSAQARCAGLLWRRLLGRLYDGGLAGVTDVLRRGPAASPLAAL
jgi:hypothetical protein